MHPVFEFSKHNYESFFEPINQRLIEENEIVRHSDLLQFITNRDKEGYQKAIRLHLQPYWEFLHNLD